MKWRHILDRLLGCYDVGRLAILDFLGNRDVPLAEVEVSNLWKPETSFIETTTDRFMARLTERGIVENPL